MDQQTTVTQPSPGGKTQTLTDAAGHVTATIDALGRVTATSYDAFGQAAEGYQGQAFNGGSATFHNLALSNVAPGGSPFLQRLRLLERGPGGHDRGPLHLGGRRRCIIDRRQRRPDGSSLGGWTCLGTVTPGSKTSRLAGRELQRDGRGGRRRRRVCLLRRKLSATAYDSDGNVTATIDARGNVTATAYDDSDNAVADYTGQALAFNGASVTFESLAPNYQNWYDVYAQGGGLNGFTSSGTGSRTLPPWARTGSTRGRWL